jgi:hypothetical protein
MGYNAVANVIIRPMVPANQMSKTAATSHTKKGKASFIPMLTDDKQFFSSCFNTVRMFVD